MLRFLHKGPKNLPITIVECAPTNRTLNILGTHHFLPFPYQVFAVAFHPGERTEQRGGSLFHAFGSLKPIISPHDEVFIFPFPNSYNNGSVCMGENYIHYNGDIRQYIDIYFNSPFSSAVSAAYWHGGNNPSKGANSYWRTGTDPFKLPWHTPKLKLINAFPGHSFPDIFDPTFTEHTIRQLAEQIRSHANGYSDEQVWIAAENHLLKQCYKRGTSG
jgi:hypothetical protein